MQAEVRYLPPHKREGGTLENVVGERPNAAKTIALGGGGGGGGGGVGGSMQPPTQE